MPTLNLLPYCAKDVLVTGGLGFIGSTLARTLVGAGARVVVIDSELDGSGANPANLADLGDALAVVRGDIADRRTVLPLIERADVVFNCAGYNNHRDSMVHPEKDYRANCVSQLAFLSLCKEAKTTARLVFIGTRTQYGEAPVRPIPEDAPQNPLDLHGAHKMLAEAYNRIFHRSWGLDTVVLRAVNTYGPRQALRPRGVGLIAEFIAAALEDGEIEIYGTGERSREILYVDDLVDALFRVAVLPEAGGERFNAGGVLMSLRSIAEIIVQAAGKGRVILKPFPPDVRRIEVGDVELDSSKIRRLSGWNTSTPPEEGLRRTVDFFLAHRRQYAPA